MTRDIYVFSLVFDSLEGRPGRTGLTAPVLVVALQAMVRQRKQRTVCEREG